mmetsp:Transcript_55335/g.164557  ORF Transcript_55335/g.164557 Transcript_55335/m.164557 type:complete len:158 (+) Transcript_55335:45-518(+)
MAVIATAAAVSTLALASSAAVIRLQRRDIGKLQQKVLALQEKAAQFEAVPKMMSMKRREGLENAQNSIGNLEAKHMKKEEEVDALKEQVEYLNEAVTCLEAKVQELSTGTKNENGKEYSPDKVASLQKRLAALEAAPAPRGCLPCGAASLKAPVKQA